MHTPFHLLAVIQTRLADGYQPGYTDNISVWRHMSDALNQSLYRVLSLLIAVLPGILAFFVALAIFTLIGMGISALLRRALGWIHFDDRLIRSRVSPEWTPTSSPTDLVARGSFWFCVLLGLLIGVSAFDASYAAGTTLPIALLPYLTHAVGAIIVLLAGTLIARFLARSVLISAVNAQLQYARFLSLGVKWLVLVLTAAMVLDHLEIGGHIVELAFGILFGGIVLTLALAVGLGSRDLVTRSLESHVERGGERGALPHIPRPPRQPRLSATSNAFFRRRWTLRHALSIQPANQAGASGHDFLSGEFPSTPFLVPHSGAASSRKSGIPILPRFFRRTKSPVQSCRKCIKTRRLVPHSCAASSRKSGIPIRSPTVPSRTIPVQSYRNASNHAGFWPLCGSDPGCAQVPCFTDSQQPSNTSECLSERTGPRAHFSSGSERGICISPRVALPRAFASNPLSSLAAPIGRPNTPSQHSRSGHPDIACRVPAATILLPFLPNRR